MEGSSQPTIALLVARFHQWPSWTPLLLKTFASNRELVDFHSTAAASRTLLFPPFGRAKTRVSAAAVLSDTALPVANLPSNVHYHRWTLEQLAARLRRTVGAQLETISASGTRVWSHCLAVTAAFSDQ